MKFTILINILVLPIFIAEILNFNQKSIDRIIGMIILIVGNILLDISVKFYRKKSYTKFLLFLLIALILIVSATYFYWELIHQLKFVE